MRYLQRWQLASVCLLALALLAMCWLARAALPVAALLALSGFAMGALTPALSNRVMEVAPGSTDLASAGNSAAYNVGIGGGSLLGAVVVSSLGVRQTALVGGLVVAGGLALMLAEPVLAGAGGGRTTASLARRDGA